MSKNIFKILSIDGGGIRGIFPARFLELIEDELQSRDDGKSKIYQHFNLITGTSTGGVIALALSLGINAKEICGLYIDNSKRIFGKKRSCIGQIFSSSHKNYYLETLIRNTFKAINNGIDPLINDCKTNVCIPIYDLEEGKPSVVKYPYHPSLQRDSHIPAYQVALATSAAPTYFDPYTVTYKDSSSRTIDGGVMVNNPTLVGLIEAIKAFNFDISDLEILSIGTGYRRFIEKADQKDENWFSFIIVNKKKWGLYYWMLKNNRVRLIELFMQSQSQLVENYMNLLHKGIDESEASNPNFVYDRIDVKLDKSNNIKMDEFDKTKLKNFAELASIKYKDHRTSIMNKHFY